MADTVPAADVAPFSAELDDLAHTHLATWLAEVLPTGPCLVWAGGPSLASVLTAAGDRTVLLVEPTTARAEHASRHPSPGVRAQPAPSGSLTRSNDLPGRGSYASAVVVLTAAGDAHEVVTSIAGHLASGAAIAVRAAPGTGADVLATLEGLGWEATVVHQEIRSASCLALQNHDLTRPSAPARGLPGIEPRTIEADIVLAGAVATPSVLLGGDATPERWWHGREDLITHLRDLDQQMLTDDMRRIHELEVALSATRASADQQAALSAQRIEALLKSTSWRMTAPVRRISEALRRR